MLDRSLTIREKNIITKSSSRQNNTECTEQSDRRRMWSSEKTIAKPAKNSSSAHIVKAAGMLFGNLEYVTFDPEIDCPPRACYNCWSFDHHIRDCREPKLREYCCNCGRKDVRVDECARCDRAFFEQNAGLKSWIYDKFMRKDQDDEHCDGEESQSFHTCGCEDGKAAKNCRDDFKKSGDFGSESPPAYTEPNDLFTYMRARKVGNDGVNLDDTRMAERNSFGENSVVFDEKDEKESSRVSGEPIHDFLNLMDAVKHLSVATQEVVVLQFMAERKKKSEMQSNG